MDCLFAKWYMFKSKVIEKRAKKDRWRWVLAYVYIRFKKIAEIFIMKFYSYSPVFPIDHNKD